ncbi:MAG: DUF4358 domain-containing protein [Ruminococcaceae bacterium]|nr:DUF4358 domain-containing protein [Oscillospiraceae bacterium]
MKKIFAIIIALLLAVFLPSCATASFADSSTCAELGELIEATVNDGQEYIPHDDTHRSLYFDDVEEYDDYFSAYSANTSDISEFGVFHAPNDEAAAELYDEVCDYVSDMQNEQRAFIASYAPDELSKLDAAKVKKFGNYVVYTVLDKDTANAVFKKIEVFLTQNK